MNNMKNEDYLQYVLTQHKEEDEFLLLMYKQN